MKRIIAMIMMMAVLVLNQMAVADVDISGLSFNELIDLREQVNHALWKCEEWEEVVVPVGLYEIGKDIPAGYWEISAYDEKQSYVIWGKTLKEDRSIGKVNESGFVTSPSYRTYDEGSSRTCFYFEMENGQYISFTGGSVVFKPFTGKDLGFKFK